MVLIDFSGARIMRKSMKRRSVQERVRTICNIEMNTLAAYFEPRSVSTSSDAVLSGHSVRPADEACSIIYAAIQVLTFFSLFTNVMFTPVITLI